MIYRIDLQHFLTHAIDHFSLQDLSTFEYAIISAKIMNGARQTNVVKINDLYPDTETIVMYADTQDKKILKKMYFDMIEPKDKATKAEFRQSNPFTTEIYQVFVNPLLNHFNVMIVCDEAENDYIDCLCEYLKKELDIEVIDLNELFKTGHVGPIYIDRDKIRDNAVDIRRAAVRDQIRSMSSTKQGKEMLIQKMSKKKKLKELEKFGIKADPGDNIDSMLLEEWCREDGQWDGDD